MEKKRMPKIAAIYAHPIGHSLSPIIHNTAFQAIGYPANYLAFNVVPADFAERLQAIKQLEMLGVNISMPYKETAYQLVDQLTDRAKMIGAINTIKLVNQQLIGDNTDGAGFVASLLTAGPIDWRQEKVVILGGGGAARALIAQLVIEQIGQLTIFQRPNQRLIALKDYVEDLTIKYKASQVIVESWQDDQSPNQAIKHATLIINATNCGMGDYQISPLSNQVNLNSHQRVVDLIYYPLETPLLKQARQAGCQIMNGLPMLVHQAALAFEWWTGEKMPIEPVFSALSKEIEKRMKKENMI